jgi:hypothetical protein
MVLVPQILLDQIAESKILDPRDSYESRCPDLIWTIKELIKEDNKVKAVLIHKIRLYKKVKVWYADQRREYQHVADGVLVSSAWADQLVNPKKKSN